MNRGNIFVLNVFVLMLAGVVLPAKVALAWGCANPQCTGASSCTSTTCDVCQPAGSSPSVKSIPLNPQLCYDSTCTNCLNPYTISFPNTLISPNPPTEYKIPQPIPSNYVCVTQTPTSCSSPQVCDTVTGSCCTPSCGIGCTGYSNLPNNCSCGTTTCDTYTCACSASEDCDPTNNTCCTPTACPQCGSPTCTDNCHEPCSCQPTTTCPGTACGPIPDGCGGTLNCGSGSGCGYLLKSMRVAEPMTWSGSFSGCWDMPIDGAKSCVGATCSTVSAPCKTPANCPSTSTTTCSVCSCSVNVYLYSSGNLTVIINNQSFVWCPATGASINSPGMLLDPYSAYSSCGNPGKPDSNCDVIIGPYCPGQSLVISADGTKSYYFPASLIGTNVTGWCPQDYYNSGAETTVKPYSGGTAPSAICNASASPTGGTWTVSNLCQACTSPCGTYGACGTTDGCGYNCWYCDYQNTCSNCQLSGSTYSCVSTCSGTCCNGMCCSGSMSYCCGYYCAPNYIECMN